MKALVMTGKMCQDQEAVYPIYRLKEAGFAVDIASPEKETFHGIQGVKFEPTIKIEDAHSVDYDLLIIPGGVKCMEHLRLNEKAVSLVKAFHVSGKIVASICSGAQMLISAGLCKNRMISCYPAMRIDVENAGGVFADRVVSFDRIVSAPHYKDLGEWMAQVLWTVKTERELQNAA